MHAFIELLFEFFLMLSIFYIALLAHLRFCYLFSNLVYVCRLLEWSILFNVEGYFRCRRKFFCEIQCFIWGGENK